MALISEVFQSHHLSIGESGAKEDLALVSPTQHLEAEAAQATSSSTALRKTTLFLTRVCPSDYLAVLKGPVYLELSFVNLFMLRHLDLLPATQLISESIYNNSLVEESCLK